MGCRVCRARKVKCDGRPNGCQNCERLQLECVTDNGLPTATPPYSSPVALRKIRTYRSCTACRASKTKCDGDRPKCSRCRTKNAECEYDGGAAPRWTKTLANPTAATPGVDQEGAAEAPSVTSQGSAEDAEKIEAQLKNDSTANPMPPSVMPPPSKQMSTDLPRRDSLTSPKIAGPDGLVADAHAWLLSPDLPPKRHLRRIVEQYFANVHPLRCFAFVHKPSFMRQLDKGFETDDENALLYIICAHGVKFHILSLNQIDHGPGLAVHRAAGSQWAKKAEYMILTNFGKVSVQRLMAAVLLYDFHFRLGEFTQALMLSGLAVRMAHALKINTEYSPDIMCTEVDESAPSVVARESRRRLMWACYVLDAWTGSGVDQLTLLRETDIKIQLPCNERNFGLRIASVTETLGVGHVLQFLPPAIVPPKPASNMGIMAYYIRIVTLWKRVVRYINSVTTGPPPWLPESEFASLESDLRLWRRELPEFVEYSADTIYARLDSNQLGSLMLIHCTYHHNFLELYKFSMPDLFRLEKRFVVFPQEHREFIKVVQAEAFFHANQISSILAEAVEHGPRLLSDALLPFFVYDSSRVMLYYVSQLLDPNRVDAVGKMTEAVQAVESNRHILRVMSPLFPIADSLATTIERWLFKIKRTLHHIGRPNQSPTKGNVTLREIKEARSRPQSTVASSATGTPDLSLPPYPVIPALGRSGVGEKHSLDGQPLGPHETAWDHQSAAQQLVGLSQEAPQRSTGLQHERPVPIPQIPAMTAEDTVVTTVPQTPGYVLEALDVDDLQNFFPWDLHGLMEIGEAMSQNGTEDAQSQSWAATH
ncbi:hypothetical protein NLU13_4700 [Sarocladium strictum]|uniref:Zn(2)-C6 fungal-type domain-containing protein n=1 Tax=Sarocladium strictum TaxID=5046 RepID=A0AA39L8F3_SARSR|nr:hypothetical protein NLU13_4700 [Sarocladium strictum]